MPAETYTNREERLKRAEKNMKEKKIFVIPISASAEEITPERRKLHTRIFKDKYMLKEMVLFIEELEGTLPELHIKIKAGDREQINVFEYQKGINEIPLHLQVPAGSLLEIYFSGGQEFLLTGVHMAAELNP